MAWLATPSSPRSIIATAPAGSSFVNVPIPLAVLDAMLAAVPAAVVFLVTSRDIRLLNLGLAGGWADRIAVGFDFLIPCFLIAAWNFTWQTVTGHGAAAGPGEPDYLGDLLAALMLRRLDPGPVNAPAHADRTPRGHPACRGNRHRTGRAAPRDKLLRELDDKVQANPRQPRLTTAPA